jgi:acetyl-CoA carboxylase carboxyl transferase subunit alpha
MYDSGLDFEKPIVDLENEIARLESISQQNEMDLSEGIRLLKGRCDRLKKEIFSGLTAWQRIRLAREPMRPQINDYLNLVFTDNIELHGDKCFGDDKAMYTGLARIGGEKIMLIGHRRGKSIKENMAYNFGSAHPEGYRKALQKMKLAEKWHLPVVCLINTAGAYPGIGAEERGQAMAIAVNLMEMARLATPIICITTGEGGSGGALGIGVGDKLSILENAYFSVISPEGCAAILWKDATKAPQAAEVLKLTPGDLLKLGIMDEIIAEPLGGAHRNYPDMASNLKETIMRQLHELKSLPARELLTRRYEKYRAIGRLVELEHDKIGQLTDDGHAEGAANQ